jgi:hypothetical protein
MNFLVRFAAGVGIEFLGVLASAERGEREGLGFAAAKDGRAMGARQNADFARDGADFVKAAAVEALAAVQDQSADGFLLNVIKRVIDDEFGDFFRAEFFDELRADFVLDTL